MRPAVSLSSFLPRLPVDFLYWWFFEASLELLKILFWAFRAFVHLLSIDSIFKTFFKPWKNEYREGLERFAIFFGIGAKSAFLIFDFFFLVGLILAEIAVFIAWVSLPIIVIWGIYAGLIL